MLILKIKDPKIEKMLNEILMRTNLSSLQDYVVACIKRDHGVLKRRRQLEF